MTPRAEQLLSEFIDAWNAGRRPALGDYVERVDDAERPALAEAITRFLRVAPAPAFDEPTLQALRAEVDELARDVEGSRSGTLPALLPRLRRRASLSIAELGARLAEALGLGNRERKVADYMAQLERGELDGRGVAPKVFQALGRLLQVDPDELARAGAIGGTAPAGALFRTEEIEGAAELRDRLEILSDAMATPAPEQWDEVDELFRGGR